MNETIPLRHSVYALLITAVAAVVAARIAGVARTSDPGGYRAPGSDDERRGAWPQSRPEPQPHLGANDRSRWLTIRTLAEEGTYVIGRREDDPSTGKYVDRGPMEEDGWK